MSDRMFELSDRLKALREQKKQAEQQVKALWSYGCKSSHEMVRKWGG